MSSAPTPANATFGPVDLGLYTATVLIFGSSWLPMRFQLGVVDPEVSAVWRFAIASVIMFSIVIITKSRLVFSLRDHMLFAFLGATLFSLNFLAFYYAGYYLPSGLMSVMFALAAVFIQLLSAISTRTWPSPRIMAGALLGILGVVLVFGPSLRETGFGSGLHIGIMATLAGTLLFSLGSLGSVAAGKRRLPQASINAYGMAYGLLLVLLAAFLKGAPFQVEWTPRYLGAVAYLIILPTLFGFPVYMQLIKRIGPSRAGYATVLFPIVALLLSTVFESYHWTWTAAVGIALVLVGNVVVMTAPKPAR